ncbi:hypothetical protein B0H14DRAFT_3493756 [Mycena olivaceomarginata]|nr:hypothetical protein B0H14DRAFT_3493756 [Mycena olivaceomarginata]
MVVLFSLAAASPIQNSTVPTGNLTIVPLIKINLGYLTLNGDHVAWFSGLPKSDYTVIGPDSVNPCTRTFDIRKSDWGTTGTDQEFGCGTPDYGINKNGAIRTVRHFLCQMPTVVHPNGIALKMVRSGI